MLAIAALSPTVTAVLFFVALVLFLLVTFNVASKINLLALGLAVWVFVLFWNALAHA